jgi:Tol biopolymer transport system component
MNLTRFLVAATVAWAALAAPASARVPSERILFSAFDGFASGLRSIKPSGEGRRVLTKAEHQNPRWSPDRTQIAFEKAREGSVTALFVAKKDGQGLRRLVRFTRGPYEEGYDWSPDGTKIVYAAAATDDIDAEHDIYVVDVDSGEVNQLTDGPADEYEPDWSPDGMKITFTSEAPGGNPVEQPNTDIGMVDADGTNPTVLTEHPHRDHSPQWSPDGSLIAFISERDDESANNPDIGPLFSELYVMDPNGENERRVTEEALHKEEFEWSPDGTRLAFHGRCDNDVCDDSETDIYAIDVDGTNRINLTDDARSEHSGEVEWSSNGRWVAYTWVRRGGRDHDVMIVKTDRSHTKRRVTSTDKSGEVGLDW